jgi:hypothetical protein
MSNRTTIAKLSLEITSEADAYAYFEKLRWTNGATCAHCASTYVPWINSTPRRRNYFRCSVRFGTQTIGGFHG